MYGNVCRVSRMVTIRIFLSISERAVKTRKIKPDEYLKNYLYKIILC